MQALSDSLVGLCEESLVAAHEAPSLRQRIAFLEAAIWFADAAYRATLGSPRPRRRVGMSGQREEARPSDP